MRASRSTGTRAGRATVGHSVTALAVTGGLLLAGLPAAQAATADGSDEPTDPGAAVSHETTTDTPSLVTGLRTRVDGKVSATKAARTYLADHADRFRIAAPAQNLDADGTTSEDGQEVVRLQQQYQGVDVLGGQYVVRMEKEGTGRTVTGTSGKYYTDLDLDTVEAKVSAHTATERAVAAVTARFGAAPLTRAAAEAATAPLTGSSEGLVILPQGDGVLTRHVTVTGVSPVDGLPVRQQVYVDAHSGFPVLQYSSIQTFGAVDAATSDPTPNVRDTARDPASAAAADQLVVKGTGTRYNGDAVEVNLYKDTKGGYQLIDYSKRAADKPYSGTMIATYDARGVEAAYASGAWPSGVQIFRPDSPDLGEDYTDSGAVDAHWAAGKVYDYYKNHLGRDSLDGKGGFIQSLVGVTSNGMPYNNAFWDGTKMVYGQGGGDFRTFSADTDVVGHEMTHGVVEHTANLVYAGQSGAMNEALADYFGNAIDLEANDISMDDPDAGLLGEDLCTTLAPRDCALRDLNDGATTFDDLIGTTFGSDNGGVHLNSTIFSGALWDMRESLGAELADQIVYRALSAYMTPLDGFLEGRDAVVAAAEELGATDAQVKSVKGFFAAHGIIPGWEKSIGIDTDTLATKSTIAGTGVGAGGGKYAISRSNEDGSEPYSVWVGNTNGKGEPKLVSPNNGDYNVYADTDGTTVVWATYSADGIAVYARPVAGGVAKMIGVPGGPVSALAVDGDHVAFTVTDPTTGYPHVGYFEMSTGTRALVDPGTPPFQTALPSVRDGKIAYARLWPDAKGYNLGVEVLDVAKGTTQLMPIDPTAVAGVGQTALTDDGVFWIEDDDLTDDGQAAVMRAGFDGSSPKTITPESGKKALFAYSLTASDDAVTVTSVPPATTWSNDTMPKLFQVSPDGEKAAKRMSCNRGEQLYATADTGKRVLWLDGTTGFTNLVKRDKPAGTC